MATRLVRRQRKQLEKKTLFFYFIIFLVVILLFNYGIPFLANSSVFFNNLFGNKDESQAPEQTFSSIEVTDIPVATNSATIQISGSINDFDTIVFMLNDQQIEDLSVKGKENFREEIGELKSGENKVYLIGKKGSVRKKTPIYTVLFNAQPPKLEISEPQDNSKTSHEDLKIAGTTDKEVSIQINNSPIVVDLNGNFQTSVKLKEGENKIPIIAQDDAGNKTEKTLTITYEKD